MPVLTAKGIDDATAFVRELDAAFKATMEQAPSSHLVQTFTRHSSHSYLTDPTYPTLMAALLRWVEEGTRPTPASIASECPALEATFGKGCAFVPEYRPRCAEHPRAREGAAVIRRPPGTCATRVPAMA